MDSQERINHDYLSQLVAISQEQDEIDLIPRLLRTLESEQNLFLQKPVAASETTEGRKAEQARVHKLKNVYFNLGCEHVGHILEEMYQALKDENESRERLPQLMSDFRKEALVTMKLLREKLASITH